MIITVDVPEPKFAHGQMVEVKGSESPYHLFVHIIRAEATGSWICRNGKASLFVEEIRYTYVYQEGSRDAMGGLIRPGTIGTKDDRLETEGTTVTWDKPIVSQDTMDNISERNRKWTI